MAIYIAGYLGLNTSTASIKHCTVFTGIAVKSSEIDLGKWHQQLRRDYAEQLIRRLSTENHPSSAL